MSAEMADEKADSFDHLARELRGPHLCETAPVDSLVRAAHLAMHLVSALKPLERLQQQRVV